MTPDEILTEIQNAPLKTLADLIHAWKLIADLDASPVDTLALHVSTAVEHYNQNRGDAQSLTTTQAIAMAMRYRPS